MSEIQKISSQIQHALTRQPSKKPNASFKEALGQAMQTESIVSPKADDLAPLGEIQSIAYPRIETSSRQMINDAGRLLDMLDRFAKDMGDPSKTLKEIEPTLMDLNQQAAILARASQKTTLQDDHLKQMIDQCHLLAKKEYLKFIRGDYI
jgi:hypothetical protein